MPATSKGGAIVTELEATMPTTTWKNSDQKGRRSVSRSSANMAFKPPRPGFFVLRYTPSKLRSSILAAIGGLTFFAVWEIAHYMLNPAQQRFLPTPQHVVVTIYGLFAHQNYLHDVLASCYRIFVSFVASILVAVPLAVLMGCFGNVRALVNPTISAARYLPAASFVPLLLVWFGPTDAAKIGLLWLGVVFFLVAVMLDNVQAVSKDLIEAALTMGASKREIVLGVVLRAAAPALMESARNMMAVGWTYLVIAEIVGATDGIGAVMMRAGRFLQVDVIIAGILTIGILGVFIDLLFRLAEWICFPWNRR